MGQSRTQHFAQQGMTASGRHYQQACQPAYLIFSSGNNGSAERGRCQPTGATVACASEREATRYRQYLPMKIPVNPPDSSR